MKMQSMLNARPYWLAKTFILLTTGLLALFGFMPLGMAQPVADGESTVAIEEGVPGGVVTNTIEIRAEVVDIDYFNRSATLLRPDGEKVTVTVGPEAVNFEDVEVGDEIVVTVAEQLVVHLDESGTAVGGSAAVMALGARAGGLAAEVQEVIATVSAIDRDMRTATLQFEDGSIRTFPVRPDIDLSEHEPGERVVFRVTDMVAIEIEKPESAN
jgi:hypothetical protein